MPAYKSVGDIPDDVDVAIVAVPSDAVTDVVLDCASKGVHGLVVISSGFAETGEEGRQRQRRLVGLSRSYGLRLIGPNALGIINTDPAVSLNASLAALMPPRGRAGFFCQSGALGSAILEKVRARGLGLSTFVSAGNRADVSGNDLLQYWEEDDSTEVVMMYLESIGNPRKFSRIARRVSLRKPIVAVRSGRTTQGVPMGHAVRKIAAPPQAVDAMFRQAGVIQVDTLDDMFDVAQLLAHQPLPRGRRVAIVGNSDALGLLAADAAASVGLVVNKQVALDAEPTAEDFEDALDAAIDDPEVDAVVAVYIPPLNVAGDQIANVLAAVGEQSDKPLVSTFLGAEGVPGAAARPRRRRLHRGPRLGAVVPRRRGGRPGARQGRGVRRVAAHPRRRVGLAPRRRPGRGPAGRRPGADEAPRRHDARPDRADRAARGVRHRPLADRAGLVAAAGADRRPPPRVGRRAQGHRRAPPGAPRPRARLAQRRQRRGDEGRLEHAQVGRRPARAGRATSSRRTRPAGVPVAVRSIEDPLFGPVVSFGISGPLTELLGDKSYRIPPLGDRDAAAMVREIRSSPMLFGYRGSETVDVAAVEQLILRVARLQHDLPQVASLELSLVLAGVSGLSVLTGAARVEPVADPRSDWFVRRMPAHPGDTIPQ